MLKSAHPDIQRDLFFKIRKVRNVDDLEPWFQWPCHFHSHRDEDIEALDCPAGLSQDSFRWPENESRILYYVETMTLKGSRDCYTPQVTEELVDWKVDRER